MGLLLFVKTEHLELEKLEVVALVFFFKLPFKSLHSA